MALTRYRVRKKHTTKWYRFFWYPKLAQELEEVDISHASVFDSTDEAEDACRDQGITVSNVDILACTQAT